MNLIVTADTKIIEKNMKRALRDQIPKAVARGITRTVYDTQAGLKGKLSTHLHRPTPFTKNALAIKRATPRTMMGKVYIKPLQAAYLWWQVMGGVNTKPKVVPARNYPLNSYGNLPRNATKGSKVYISDKRGKRSYFKLRGTGGNRVLQLMAFISKHRSYSKTYPFYLLGEFFVRKSLAIKIRQEVSKIT